jgi:hypothetical protein
LVGAAPGKRPALGRDARRRIKTDGTLGLLAVSQLAAWHREKPSSVRILLPAFDEPN